MLADKWYELRKRVQNLYFEYVNPRLGQLREEISDFGVLKRFAVPDNLPMWIGIAAGITGLLLLVDAGLYWYWQLVLILLIIFIGPWLLRIASFLFHGADNVLAVYPGKQAIGRKFTLEKAIEGGVGELVLHGDKWNVRGDDLPAGTRVKVVAVKKDVLYVVTAMSAFDEESPLKD